MKQMELDIYKGKHGGYRPKAGRPRFKSKGVRHRIREKVTAHTPLHINFKYSTYVRTSEVMSILEIACFNACKFDFEVCYYTLESNHVHLIAEAPNTNSMIQGMRSLTNTIVKRIGKGSIQIERYHLHVLKNPTETYNALNYVVNNDIKHIGKKNINFSGTFSSGESFLLQKAEKKFN